jgi:hypothetical protein
VAAGSRRRRGSAPPRGEGLDALGLRIGAVRARLVAGDHPSQVLGLLYSTVAPAALIVASQDHDDPSVCRAVSRSVAAALGRDIDVRFHAPQRLPAHDLVHGTFDVGRRRGFFLYADDEDVGVLSIGAGRGALEVRFRVQVLPFPVVDAVPARTRAPRPRP